MLFPYRNRRFIVPLVALSLAGILYGVFLFSQSRKVKVYIGDAAFQAEIAETIMQKAKGLAGRTSLGEQQGMLFVFTKLHTPTFWMFGMKFPIDIIWIKEGRVIGVESNVPYDSMRLYRPTEPVQQALEVPAGTVQRYDIKIGDAFSYENNSSR